MNSLLVRPWIRRAILLRWLCVVAGIQPLIPAADAVGAPAADGTVFIRIVGDVTLARSADDRAWSESVEIPDVTLGAGSGFLISPSGYVLTCDHVVQGGRFRLLIRGELLWVTVKVKRVEVVVPESSEDELADSPRAFEATLVGSDPQVDLAVLFVNRSELPYLPLGDADALRMGDQVTVLGFPGGSNVALEGSPELEIPGVSLSSGVVSAFRGGDALGTRWPVRYIQTSAPLNPGQSGGPMLDADGYVVGVVNAKAAKNEGVGFAIPINVVRRFLELQGLDSILPASPLVPESWYEAPAKGLRLLVPYGFADASGMRLRVDSGSSLAAVKLHIDRVATTRGLDEVERALVSGRTFEPFAGAVARAEPARRTVTTGRARTGIVRGEDESGAIRMLYIVVALAREAVVARYVGPADDISFNVSALQRSLSSLEVKPLLTNEVARRPVVEWVPAGSSLPGSRPASWWLEDGGPAPCPGLPPPEESWSASPVDDFTIALRVALRRVAVPPVEAIKACAADHRARQGAGYNRAFESLGTSYFVRGAFVALADGGLLQLEIQAPLAKHEVVSGLFAEWLEHEQAATPP